METTNPVSKSRVLGVPDAYLSSHTSAQRNLAVAGRIHLIVVLRFRPAMDHGQHDRRGELVVSLPSALRSLEDVDRVPGA